MENRNGLAVGGCVTHATGYAERDAALEIVQALPVNGRITLGADKAYDTEAFVAALRANRVTPHVAQNDTTKRSAIDGRTLRKTKYQGRERVDWAFVFALGAYNLVRMRGLATA